jgi:hypothetical protein
MTSYRQIEANRRNSRHSTGPKTENGKRQSRRNALRHGLCAETVVEIVEDIDDYKAFEAAIIADYDAQTAVERELVLRLASLLWRLRRATSIETDLLRIQAEILQERRQASAPLDQSAQPHNVLYRLLKAAIPPRLRTSTDDDGDDQHDQTIEGDHPAASSMPPVDPSRDLSHSFLRLANLDKNAFDRLRRYEAALWRQTVQTVFALESIRRRFHRIGNRWDQI